MGSRLLSHNCIIIKNMSNEVAKKLSEKIIKLRKEYGMSQEELAFAANVDRTYIGRIENLKRSPTLKTLEKLAKAFNMEVWKLLKPDE